MLCDDGDADRITAVITESSRTGQIGDGKIWVIDVGQVVRVRTGELGPEAI